MQNSRFTLLQGIDTQYYFNLKAGNGEIILQSEGYVNKNGALNGIKSVQENSSSEERFEHRVSRTEEPYFVLKAKNGQIIGRSEMYSSTASMLAGIKSVMNNGQTDFIEDVSEDSRKHRDIPIIVNGRSKEWHKKTISFEELVILAFGTISENPNTCYTVTYSRGNGHKPTGSLIKGEVIKVKPKMIFNVSATDKS
ncbi:multiubiquitin domain-containing protein [Owenweeksia hongkongensis]|uniref:multiubiquitin domain-containing protein n=1 Tax=Owenweeksia hongkongensis TaxID=253245 RepID=UPI003A935BD2